MLSRSLVVVEQGRVYVLYVLLQWHDKDTLAPCGWLALAWMWHISKVPMNLIAKPPASE